MRFILSSPLKSHCLILLILIIGDGCARQQRPVPKNESAGGRGGGSTTDPVIIDDGSGIGSTNGNSSTTTEQFSGTGGVEVSFAPFGTGDDVYNGFKIAYIGDDGQKKEFPLQSVSSESSTSYSVTLNPNQSKYDFFLKLYKDDSLVGATMSGKNGLCDPVVWTQGDGTAVNLASISVCMKDPYNKIFGWNKDGLIPQYIYQKFGLASDLGAACKQDDKSVLYMKCNGDRCTQTLVAGFDDHPSPVYIGFSSNIVYDPAPASPQPTDANLDTAIDVNHSVACDWTAHNVTKIDGASHCWAHTSFEAPDPVTDLEITEDVQSDIPDLSNVVAIELKIWREVTAAGGGGDEVMFSCLLDPVTKP